MWHKLLLDLRFHISITVFIFILMLLISYILNQEMNISLLVFIFLAGSAGGIINSYRRLQKLSLDSREKMDDISNILAIIQVYVSPTVAGLLALILYLLTLSGLIAGELFPKFVGLDGNYVNISDIFTNVTPAQRMDAIKAITWGFIAGFFEKFVPNTLDSIVKDIHQEERRSQKTLKGANDAQ